LRDWSARLKALLGKTVNESLVISAHKWGVEKQHAGKSHKERLIAFYQEYQPDKVDQAESFTENYKGKGKQMWAVLAKKYGPEPV